VYLSDESDEASLSSGVNKGRWGGGGGHVQWMGTFFGARAVDGYFGGGGLLRNGNGNTQQALAVEFFR
jgi:hypothetical protein